MTFDERAALGRIADALERLAPARPEVDWQVCTAAEWRVGNPSPYFAAHTRRDAITLDDLFGIDRQKRELDLNTQQFLAGLPANNALLWGSRGTGKSTLMHAILQRHAGQGLRVIEPEKRALAHLPELADQLRALPYRFILFCDDLSFEADDPAYKSLKSALEGSTFTSVHNLLIYATSNRRHLLPEYNADNADARVADGELHHGEAVEERISLSDRFGLWLSFYAFRQDDYLQIARHWVLSLSAKYATNVALDGEGEREALRWALARGGRSGRVAQQFARHWVGRHLLSER